MLGQRTWCQESHPAGISCQNCYSECTRACHFSPVFKNDKFSWRPSPSPSQHPSTLRTWSHPKSWRRNRVNKWSTHSKSRSASIAGCCTPRGEFKSTIPEPLAIYCESFMPIAVTVFCRTMLCICASYAVMWCLSVCPSITFVHSVEMSKHIFKIFHHTVATPFSFFCTKRYGIIPTGISLTRASSACGVGKNRDSRPISGFSACCQRCDR